VYVVFLICFNTHHV